MDLACDAECWIGAESGNDVFSRQPINPHDEDYQGARDALLEDFDVLQLFDDGDLGRSDGSDDEESTVELGKSARFMLSDGPLQRQMGLGPMHPQDWFVAFRNEKMKDHL